MGAEVKSAPHILDLEMLRDQIAHDLGVLRDEAATLDESDSQHARTFGAWCNARDVLGHVETMIAGWRNNVPQSLKAETLINNGNEWVECKECCDFVHPDDALEILLDDNGPGEPPSSDGHVCQACNEKAEIAAREIEADAELGTYQPDLDPNVGTYQPEHSKSKPQ